MADQGGNKLSAIPAQPANTRIFYYVEGNANSGKVQVRPIVAPEGWWSLRILDPNTGIGEGAMPMITEVYPNPANALVVIALSQGSGQAEVRILDATGRVVMQLHAGDLPSDGRLFADVSPLRTGVYQVEVRTAAGRSTHALLKYEGTSLARNLSRCRVTPGLTRGRH